MFGSFKLSGAPPRAYTYYKQLENIEEKKIMEDLYSKFSSLLKKYEKVVMQEAKLEPSNRNEPIKEFRKRQEAMILHSEAQSFS